MQNSSDPYFDSTAPSNEEVVTGARLFPNGRIFSATTQRLVEYQDGSGLKSFRTVATASADCGCYCSLSELSMCRVCQRIICPLHRIERCDVCTGIACSLCSLSAVKEADASEANPSVAFLCKVCFEDLVKKNTPLFIRVLRWLLEWLKP